MAIMAAAPSQIVGAVGGNDNCFDLRTLT